MITHTQKRRIQAWIDALPSYKQTTGALRKGDRFCCLGVATDVACKAQPKLGKWINTDAPCADFKTAEGFTEAALLPWGVQKFYGFQGDAGPDLLGLAGFDSRGNLLTDGAHMNDAGKKFVTIGRALQKWLDAQEVKGR